MFELMMGVAYPVKDVTAAHEFYSRKLGIRETFAGDGKTWAALRVGEKTLMLVATSDAFQAKPGYGAGVLFTVRDLDGTIEELRRREVQVSPVMNVPNGGRAAYFRDPDGNSLGIFEPPSGPVQSFTT